MSLLYYIALYFTLLEIKGFIDQSVATDWIPSTKLYFFKKMLGVSNVKFLKKGA